MRKIEKVKTPNTNGFYWLYVKKEVFFVKVWDLDSENPMVAFIGNDCDEYLKTIKGSWVGPIQDPLKKLCKHGTTEKEYCLDCAIAPRSCVIAIKADHKLAWVRDIKF